MLDIFLLLSSPFIGILVGFLPAMGAFFTLLLMYPLLMDMDPLLLILFYSILISARDFSGSVSALNFGILGEVTSLPVLQERKKIIDNHKQKEALRNTMIGSVFGMIMGLGFLLLILAGIGDYSVLLRTDVMAVLICLTIVFLVFWDKNKWYMNLVIGACGYLVAMVGFDPYIQKEYFTFGNVYLSGGVPTMPLLLGLYGVPAMFAIIRHTKLQKPKTIHDHAMSKVRLPILFRSSVIGSLCGFVPYIGSVLSSNIAYMFEKKITTNNVQSSLDRIVASETANNASQVTVLIPFILIGIALQPSELLVLDMIENKGWEINFESARQTTFYLIIALPIGCLISAFLCYNMISRVLHFFQRHHKKIIYSLLAIIIANIFYLGYDSNQSLYYMLVFTTALPIGFYLRKHFDLMPFIMCFLLQNQFQETLIRLPILY